MPDPVDARPRWLTALLQWLCPDHLLEEIEGDLSQRFERDKRLVGESTAKRRLFWRTVSFLRPGIILRRRDFNLFPQTTMWRSYLNITFRTLKRNKLYSSINVIGLSVGIASAILILLWVRYQYSFDDFAANRNNIHQIKINFNYDGVISTEDNVCVPVYTTLKNDQRFVKNVCLTSNTFGHLLTRGERLSNKEIMAVSSEFLEMFGITLIRGDLRALDDPYSILLNESTARELFGDADPVNQFIKLNNDHELRVTGVFKDVPRNSTFWFHALISTGYYDRPGEWLAKQRDRWDDFYPHVYAELQSGITVSQFNEHIRDMVKAHVKDASEPQLLSQAMNRWYLYDKFVDGKEAGGQIEYVHLFTWAAIFILAIACINYMNLATARSERRAREIGVRKSIGSGRRDIVQQFLFESGIITLISFLAGVAFVVLCLPYYNDIVHAPLSIYFMTSLRDWGWLIGLFSITAFIAGSYPAFYFSSLQPVRVLKGVFTDGTGRPRKILMTVQHTVSIFLLVGAVAIYLQINHAKDRSLGYDQTGLICYAVNEEIDKHYEAIKSELLRTGTVDAVTIANQGIDVDYFTDNVEWEGKVSNGKIPFTRISTKYDYTSTHKIRMLEGRDFSPDIMSDSNAVIINKTAAELMKLDDPIGKTITIREGERTIIGVMDDVLRASPFEPVRPLYMGLLKDGNNHITIRLKRTNDLAASVGVVNDVFRKMDPLNIDEPDFVDERFAYNFRSIELVGALSKFFAILAVVLTALGILGLAVYTTEQRAHEIAIRKVLGANFRSLMLLLSNYFVRVVAVSMLMSAPVSWWLVQRYLESYTYRIEFPWWLLPCASLSMLIVTLLIVLTQVIKASAVSPVSALKSE